MTVSSTNSTQTFSGGQSVLTFSFAAIPSSPQYINVSVIALTGGTITALSYSTQYTVTVSTTGVGGTVIVSPSYGSNYNYVVFRQTSITQNSNYTNYNSFPATTLMANLDQLTMIDQEANTNTGLAMSYLIGTTGFSTTMPIPSIGTVVTCNSAGTQWIATAGIAGPTGPSGSTGSVGSVSSSTSDITIVSISTTPIITSVNAATAGANVILRLNSSGGLPALNGSLLTSVATLGIWSTRAATTIYQAATDGFFVASCSITSGTCSILSDSSSTPTTTRSTAMAGTTNSWVFPLFSPSGYTYFIATKHGRNSVVYV